jgi:quercetin dioxygenase-like cupin family protein
MLAITRSKAMFRRISFSFLFCAFLGLFWAATENAQDSSVPPHQPGQAVFGSVLPEAIDWKPFPAFPPSVRLAVVVGEPSTPHPYVVRVKVPSGVKLMPHRHPEDRVYTVLSGVFYIGLGETFDADQLMAYPPGAVVILPGNTFHYHWAKSGEYVTQVTAIGPLGLEYRNAQDDPRHIAPGARK